MQLFFMRQEKLDIGELQVILPLVQTVTKHLAVRVAFDETQPVFQPDGRSGPVCHSLNDDLYVYFGKEAGHQREVCQV